MERQELYCHNCGRYVQFNIDPELNGQHEIKCPNCGHVHYRYVRDGIITDQRWGSSNLPVYQATSWTTTSSTNSASANINFNWSVWSSASTVTHA